jgi:hydroxyethylthiazole kinase-like uncharacterized protein yjeF
MDRQRPGLPCRVLQGTMASVATGWPLHDTAASRALEAAAAAPLPTGRLMERAGEAAARLALALAPHARRVWIAAGPGNNGGDGYEAAWRLHAAGRDVTVSRSAGRGAPPADAPAALERARSAGVRIVDDPAPPGGLGPEDLALDALFGLGLSRPAEGRALTALHALNAAPCPVLALDLPSGLDADSGRRLGEAVRARWTLALLSLKPGLFTADGRDCCGETWFDALGADLHAVAPSAWLLTRTDALRPARAHAQHKGSFGDVWVVGGAPGMSGAVRLAARAALAAGAGRVHLAALDPQAAGLDAAYPELLAPAPQALAEAATPLERATVVCGCGGGEAVRPLLPLVLSRAGRLLLDADALNALAADPALAPLAVARAARGRETVMTPHPLEAARLLSASTAEVQADRICAARTLSERYRATVVLKGSGSVIASPGEPPWINGSGNAALATAGTGDVLAGWIGGWWSQGLAAPDAARLGVHAHGAAADRWRAARGVDAALAASELIGALR